MKVVFVLPGVPVSATGGSTVVFEYANALKNNNYNVEIDYFHTAKYNNKILEFIRFIYLSFKAILVEPKWFNLNKDINRKIVYYKVFSNSDDSVLVATSIETVDIVLKSNIKNKVYFIQDFENWSYSDEEVYKTYSMGMTNIVVAKWLKDIVDKHSSEPSYLVSNCINTDIYYDRKEKRRKHSIVFHYRATDYKGPKYAIEAIEKLHKLYPDLVVDVISTGEKPDNLPSCCTFHHSITAEEIVDINNKSEIFMCTSVEEGFGLPGLEAMACGCALVSSSYRGVLEYAVNSENSLLSPVKDVDDIVENVIKLFEDDKLRKKIVENGVKTGKERSLEKSTKEFESILLDCCKGK